MKKIQLASDEGIFISRNVISFVLEPDRDFVLVLDDIFNVLEENKKIFKRIVPIEINNKNIPESLKQLIPLLKKYSVSDDVERTQLIEDMSKKKKALLIEAVNPCMDEINNYLSSFDKQPMNEEAALIGTLAELVTELKIKQ
ncbi:MAG: hypothetical protein DI535_04215 [Citrobacter freundii]|nr:MAG: hypothetical protein DI535_04215 [Citrobacter freundii]